MPEVFADEHPHPAERRGKRLDAVAGGEEASLVEHAVGRQVDFAMDVAHPPAGEEQGAVVKAMTRRFLDQSDDHRDPPARLEQRPDGLRLIEAHRHVGDQVLEQISRQAELWKDEQIGPPGNRLPCPRDVPRHVRFDVTQDRLHLRQGDARPCARTASCASPRHAISSALSLA